MGRNQRPNTRREAWKHQFINSLELSHKLAFDEHADAYSYSVRNEVISNCFNSMADAVPEIQCPPVVQFEFVPFDHRAFHRERKADQLAECIVITHQGC